MEKSLFSLKFKNSKASFDRGLKTSVFKEDEDCDEVGGDLVNQRCKIVPRLTKTEEKHIEQAVKEDPNVFCYDEVYDEIGQSKRTIESKSSQPKYISNLLKAHSERELERERRFDRIIQRELEAEGDEFADKEVFVTNSYKEKMKKLAEEEQKRKREEEREEILDVKKQGNMNGFFKFQIKNMDRKRNHRKLFCGLEESDCHVHEFYDVDDTKSEHREQIEPVFKKKSANDELEDLVESVESDKNETKSGVEQRALNLREIQKKIKSRAEEIKKVLVKKTVGVQWEEAKMRYFEREKQRIIMNLLMEKCDDL